MLILTIILAVTLIITIMINVIIIIENKSLEDKNYVLINDLDMYKSLFNKEKQYNNQLEKKLEDSLQRIEETKKKSATKTIPGKSTAKKATKKESK